MALKDWEPVCRSPQALIRAGLQRKENLPPLLSLTIRVQICGAIRLSMINYT